VGLNIPQTLILWPLVQQVDETSIAIQARCGQTISDLVEFSVHVTAETGSTCAAFDYQQLPSLMDKEVKILHNVTKEPSRRKETIDEIDCEMESPTI